MARDQIDMTPIESRDELVAWLEAGCKPTSEFRIGTEHEKFAVHARGPPARCPTTGARGIRALLEGMQHLLGWEPIMEGGNIIGLLDVTGGGAISLEPGGQFELSGAPVETVHQTAAELMAHLAQVREIATPLGIGFLGLGMTPSWSRADMPVMPKGRYKIMTNYMPKVGTLRPRHDVPDLHGADQSRLLLRSRHGQEAARVARAAAGGDRAVRQFAVHRRQAERLPLVPLRDLARHRQRSAPACCRWRSRTAWASSATSITRSTCRCISSSAATTTSTSPASRSAISSPASSTRCPASAPTHVGLGQSSVDDFPRGAAQALSRDARRRRRAVAAAAGAAGVLGRPALRRRRARCLPGTWSRTGPRRSARRCATTCRSCGFTRRDPAAATCSRSRRRRCGCPRAGLTRRARLDRNGRDETRYLRPLEEIVARGITPAEELLENISRRRGAARSSRCSRNTRIKDIPFRLAANLPAMPR